MKIASNASPAGDSEPDPEPENPKPLYPSSPPQAAGNTASAVKTVKRVLQRNLISLVVYQKIKEAERRKEVGERELGFYLLEMKERKLYLKFGCSSFRNFVFLKTGLKPRKALRLVQAARALESLPLLDEAFSRGEVYWAAVRAIARVATAQTDRDWVEFAKNHRVDQVEQKVASMKPGESPKNHRWGGAGEKFPYRHKFNPEDHQAVEYLVSLLSMKRGRQVSIEEVFSEAINRMLQQEMESDGANGTERTLPSSFRRVISQCGDCKEYAVATSEGPVGIPAARAEELLQGADALDVRNLGGDGCPIQKNGNGNGNGVQQQAPSEGVSGDQKVSVRTLFLSQTPTDSPSLVKHSENLCTPETPRVPREERDLPNTPEIREKVLSRDGFFCQVPGCTNIAEVIHHIVERSRGGRTVLVNLISLCKDCHNRPIHGSQDLLISGTGYDPIFSDKNMRPLQHLPGSEPTSLELEVEPREPERITGEIKGPSEGPSTPRPARPAPAQPAGKLAEFLGQRESVQSLEISIKAAKIRGELPPSVLLSGPPGLGKTTIAGLVASELAARMHTTCGPVLKDTESIHGILSGLKKGDVLFIDEIHRMPHAVAECLYQALDDGTLPVMETSGSQVQATKLHIEPFLLVGATTEESLLPRPLHSRFGIKERLDFYSRHDLERIARKEGQKLGVVISPEAACTLARGSRGTPRNLLALLGTARDLAQVDAGSAGCVVVTDRIARRALKMQGIDSSGLGRTERKILRILIEKGRPIGLRSLADLLGEAQKTLAEVYEPYLLREGFLMRTSRGRVATDKARALF